MKLQDKTVKIIFC